mgnify:CR=1 FL=1
MAAQKVKKVPYDVLLGKIGKNQSLKEWQKNNKQLEEKVYEGTKTLNEWRNMVKVAHPNKYGEFMGEDNDFIGNFTQNNRENWTSNRKVGGFQTVEDRNPGDFLRNFEIKKID